MKGIAEAHGGDVRVETRAGEGSTLTLVLPARRSERRDSAGARLDLRRTDEVAGPLTSDL